MKTRPIRFGLIAALLALAGCATEHWVYEPPQSSKGMACVEKCGTRQETCRTKAADAAASKQSECERAAAADYNSCLKYSKDRDKCYESGCYETADISLCETDYRACYQTCGGKVTLIKD
jgi:hypothetical protein